MSKTLNKLTKAVMLASLLVITTIAIAQDGTIYPLKAPAEPTLSHSAQAVLKDSPRPRLGSDSGVIRWRGTFPKRPSRRSCPNQERRMARPSSWRPEEASDGYLWVTKAGKLLKRWQTRALLRSCLNTDSIPPQNHSMVLKSQ